jgi:hypothetical protein
LRPADLRRQIAFEAARMLHDGQETEYPRAKRRAARKLGFRFRAANLPSNREVREHLLRIQDLVDAHRPTGDLRSMRVQALRLMRLLRRFRPRLVGRVWTGAVRPGEAIELRIGSDRLSPLETLEAAGLRCTVETPLARAQRPDRRHTTVLVHGPIPARLRIAPQSLAEEAPQGMRREEAGAEDLERLLRDERNGDLEAELQGLDPATDRFEVYRFALAQLEETRQDPATHPEGDALYHSLQVFELAVGQRPYDEEFLTAALLHDLGKAVDAPDPVVETLGLLEGVITHRTRWLIAQLPAARLYRSRELPADERRWLEASDDFEELLLLAELDEAGRRPGASTRSLDEAIAYLRALDDGRLWESVG